MRGKVKWFNHVNGFGFITVDGSEHDVFAHFADIDTTGYKTLEEGERVEFDIEIGKRGEQAKNIKRIDKDFGSDSMINPSRLREIADNKKKEDGDKFVLKIMPELENVMTARAENGEYELDIREVSLLNEQFDNWLSKPNLYKPVIKHLEDNGFKVSHCDDMRDGTYLIIRW